MTYIAIGYVLGGIWIALGFVKGNPLAIAFGVCLLGVTVWEAGKS